MAFGQSYVVSKLVGRATRFIVEEFFDGSEDDAKMAGTVVGGAVGLFVAVATLDPAGGGAVIGSGQWTLENT